MHFYNHFPQTPEQNKMLEGDGINRILMWTDNFDFSVYLDEQGKGDYMSLAIFRQDDS